MHSFNIVLTKFAGGSTVNPAGASGGPSGSSTCIGSMLSIYSSGRRKYYWRKNYDRALEAGKSWQPRGGHLLENDSCRSSR